MFVETHHAHLLQLRMILKEIQDDAAGDGTGDGEGHPVDPGADGGERQGCYALFHGKGETALIAAFQQLRLPRISSPPDRARGMDDVLRR